MIDSVMYLNEIDNQSRNPKPTFRITLQRPTGIGSGGQSTSRVGCGDALNDVERALVSLGRRRASAKSSKVIPAVQ